MHHPTIREFTLETIEELGICKKIEIVNLVIDKLIQNNNLPHLYGRERDIIHGLISLGWDMSNLKDEGLVNNNGKRGAKARWYPTNQIAEVN
tara:strand:+ start:370 stop:645 length:276 start_codon:yes stop_codon:yes gene_type:complete